MTTLEYFRLFAQEFSNIEDSEVNKWLFISSQLIDVNCLGNEKAEMAQALYAAHIFSLSYRASKAGSYVVGQVISEKEGDLQRNYSVLSNPSFLSQTNYGQQYIDITKSCYGAAIMTRGNCDALC